jgi:hypothetical protein
VSKDRAVQFREISPAAAAARPAAKTPRRATALKPAANHPWRKGLPLGKRAANQKY